MKIGYFEHWTRPAWSFYDLMECIGLESEKIDCSKPDYLEKFDAIFIEQGGFNDFIENDSPYIQDWVKRGGICCFMHQNYERYAPGFLPEDLGNTMLIHRHIPTIWDFKIYMMPSPEAAGTGLFATPNKITPEEMVYWEVPMSSGETLKTAATACYLSNSNWKILGSYADPGVTSASKAALIMEAAYGKGLYFFNQILMPEVKPDNSDRCFSFWRKYMPNLLSRFERFKANLPEPAPAVKKAMPVKRNYKTALHMHCLDWYGADSQPGTMLAAMRYYNWDICVLAVKNDLALGGSPDLDRFSDERVLFLHGQEFHPFNWSTTMDNVKGHNNFHILAMGVDGKAYTEKFTRSFFSDEAVDRYLREALDHVHAHGGVASATHPTCDYWRNYPYDAVDIHHFGSAAGTEVEKHWLSGNRITAMVSIDYYGVQRLIERDCINFLYLDGTPSQKSFTDAIKKGHCIPAIHFLEADVTLDGLLPGDTVRTAKDHELFVSARTPDDCEIRELRVYADDKVIQCINFRTSQIELTLTVPHDAAKKFFRVEIEGEKSRSVAVTNPFYIVQE